MLAIADRVAKGRGGKRPGGKRPGWQKSGVAKSRWQTAGWERAGWQKAGWQKSAHRNNNPKLPANGAFLLIQGIASEINKIVERKMSYNPCQ